MCGFGWGYRPALKIERSSDASLPNYFRQAVVLCSDGGGKVLAFPKPIAGLD